MFDFWPPINDVEKQIDRQTIEKLSLAVASCGLLTLVNHLRGGVVKMGKQADKSKFALNAKLAWLIQECPSFFVAAVIMWNCNLLEASTPTRVVVLLYLTHYFNRSFVYTFRMSRKCTPVSLSPFIMAFVFCFVNAYNISKFASVHGDLPEEWKHSVTFVVGVLLWIFGFCVNNHSDSILLSLRTPGSSGYKIPRGGAFEYVSGGNFFGEIVEWWGLAAASNFQLPILCFAVSTSFVIGCRACAHHKFYKEKFEDYPKDRKAVIPFLL